MRHTYVFVGLFVLTPVFQTLDAYARLVNNGYEDVRIFIGDTIRDDPALIDRIKDVFTNASNMLFIATKQRAYFRNITIVIPRKWARDPDNLSAPGVSSYKEHIRIVRCPADRTPWTTGNTECGKPGRNTRVTPDNLIASRWSVTGIALMREWATLRWGVFGENDFRPDPIFPLSTIDHFYTEEGEQKPSICSADIEGQARTSCKVDEGEICDRRNLTLWKNCTFCPNQTQHNIRSSIMSHPSIPTKHRDPDPDQSFVNTGPDGKIAKKKKKQIAQNFCDEASLVGEGLRHNSRAPNQQNRLCNGRSVWEVMREHEDFSGSNNPPADADTDTTPSFNVVQLTFRKLVILVDASDNFTQQFATIADVIESGIGTLLEENSTLSIVTYGSSERLIDPIMEVRNKSKVRNQLRMKVPTSADGVGNIKAALELAVKSLEDTGEPIHGAEIVLVNGNRSSEPYDSMVPVLKGKGIVVHTVAVGNNADESLTLLSRSTGGRSFSYHDNDAVALADVLLTALSTGDMNHNRTETVFSATVEIKDNTSGKLPFYIDDGIGNETTVFAYLNITPMASIRVVGRNGTHQLEFRRTRMLKLEMGDQMPGEYTLEILTLAIGMPVMAKATVMVTSKPVSQDVDIIRATSYWSSETLNYSQKGEELKIYAIVEKGCTPVLNANVTAILTGGSTLRPVVIQLQDNGISYAIRRNIQGNGLYNAKIKVSGERKAFLYTASIPAASTSGEEVNLNPKAVTLGNFYRQSLPGSITVENYENTTSDKTPPARVTNLHVDDIRYHNDSIGRSIIYKLSWTAVGDDMDVGQAEEYDLRMHEDIDTLRKSFKTARVIRTEKPSIAGERENLTLKLNQKHCNGTCYLGLKVKDAGGLISDLSNIVNADVNFTYKSEKRQDVNETGIENNGTGDNETGTTNIWTTDDTTGTTDDWTTVSGTRTTDNWTTVSGTRTTENGAECAFLNHAVFVVTLFYTMH